MNPVTSASHPRPSTNGARKFLWRFAALFALLLLVLSSAGCGARVANDRVIQRHGLDVYLRSTKPMFGDPVDRGFDQPAVISAQRVSHILGSIEIEVRESARVSERRPAIPAAILETVSAGVSEAFAEAGPGQSIAVMAIRKQMQHGVFNRKYLTSFVTYMRNGQLYVHMSRVDWKIDDKHTEKLPMPQIDETQMPFRTVTNDYMLYAGRQGLEIDWRDPIFTRYTRLPGTITEGHERKTVLMEESGPLPGDEGRLRPDQIDQLSPAGLRDLADIEEDRQQGKITESEYIRNRKQILKREGLD